MPPKNRTRLIGENMKRIKKYFYAPLFGLFFLLPVSAATITVTNTNDAGAGSLRATIAAAAPGDTIVFNISGCPCIIRLSSQLTVDKNLTITGPGAGLLTVSGENVTRVFNITGAFLPGTITLSGLTIANGRLGSALASLGAGIYNTSLGTLNINDSVITTNTIAAINNPAAGAGIAHDTAGTLNITGGSITNNTLSTNDNELTSSGAGLAVLSGGQVNLTGVTVTGNQATHGSTPVSFFGGAILNASTAAFNLTGCNVSNNTITSTAISPGAPRTGGAAMANLVSGSVTIRNSIFDGNVATGAERTVGGAFVNVSDGSVTIDRVVFSNNRAAVAAGGVEASGGGLANASTGSITITDTGFTSNQATAENAFGGGLANLSTATVTASSSAFSGNVTDSSATGRASSGGGVYNGGGTLNLTNCTVANNTNSGRGQAGGGIASRGPANTRLSLVNCTIAGNTSGDGGGVFTDTTGNTAINTIIANNTAASGPDVSGTFVSSPVFGHNLIGKSNGSTGFTNGVNGNQVGTIAAPLNPLLGPLAENGGYTLTMSLQSGSPAIDKARATVTTDQRGVTRPMDNPAIPPATNGDNSDIGAFEVDVCGTGTVVSNTNDSGPGSLRCAVDSSTSGDTITFSVATPATINLLSELTVSKSLTINGAGQVVVSGNNSTRVFNIPDGNFDVTFANLVISGGRVNGGPAVLERGAGVLNLSRGVVSFNNAVVSGNTVTNPNPSGDNINGGGIAHVGGGTLSLFAATVSGNLADGRNFDALGGGIYADSGSVSINASTISGNTASGNGNSTASGGGLYCTGTCDADVVNSTFSGNLARGFGSGIFADGTGVKNVFNCTFTLNGNAPVNAPGGGIYHVNATGVFNVKNTIIARNLGPLGRQDVSGNFVSGGFNFIGANSGAGSATGFGAISDQVGTAPAPLDPLLGPLENNGGPTLTHRLLPNSRAIDKGGAASLARTALPFQSKTKGRQQRPFGSVNTDQRGVMRPVDFPNTDNAVGGDGSDIGSYEIQAPTAAHVSVSGRVVTADGSGLRNAFVVLTDAAGNVRTARTSSFGYFTFDDVEVGQAYIITLMSKRYVMQPQILNVDDAIADLDLIAEPRQQ